MAIVAKRPKSTEPMAPNQQDVAKLAEVVRDLAQHVRQLALLLDEIREDLIHAVRNTGLDPAISPGEHQNFLDQISEAVQEMEETDAPVGTRKIIQVPVESVKVDPPQQPTRSLFE